MSITLLRTLTRKSKAGWGHYADFTIQDLINVNRLELLNWYYNLGSITFADEILDELLISSDYRIKKPGSLRYSATLNGMTSYSIIKYLNHQHFQSLHEHEKIKILRFHSFNKKDKKIASHRNEIAFQSGASRMALQYSGQNHKGNNLKSEMTRDSKLSGK